MADTLSTKGGWTPGPWHECKNGTCNCGIIWSIPGDFPVCTAAGGSTFPVAVAHEHMADAPDLIYQSIPPAMCEANARLISAAPDLFEALERLLKEYEYGEWQSSIIDKARAALAKALPAPPSEEKSDG